METNSDEVEVLETATETATETVETPVEPQFTAEQIAELQTKAAKVDDLESKNKQLFERLEKAKVKAPSKETGDLSSRDVIFLAKADVPEEDLDTVLDWAKFKKISVADAHKEMKSVLDIRAEERRTANATHTKGGARGTSKVSGTDLLAAASRNEEIEATDENYNAIFNERLARKTAKFKRR